MARRRERAPGYWPTRTVRRKQRPRPKAELAGRREDLSCIPISRR